MTHDHIKELQERITCLLAIDLCCGLGGWTDGFLEYGYRVVGFDLRSFQDYPGELVIQDVRTLDGSRLRSATVIVASPPCQEFSRWDLPWKRKLNPPCPDLSIVDACRRIAREAHVPLILENVRGAQRWIGKATAHYGPFYLWGGGVPALLPRPGALKQKQSFGPSNDRAALRSRIPLELARWIASCYERNTVSGA